MEIKLRGKYRVYGSPIGFPAKARTGNSHGPAKSKLPAKVPCKRAPAGLKSFNPDPHTNMRQMAKIVDGRTGKSHMVEVGRISPDGKQINADAVLASLGLV